MSKGRFSKSWGLRASVSFSRLPSPSPLLPSVLRSPQFLRSQKAKNTSNGRKALLKRLLRRLCNMKQLRVLLLSPLDGKLVHRRVTPSSMSPVPIYTPKWTETIWVKVSCLRKQHDDRDWASSHQPSDLKSNTLTTTPTQHH